MPNAKKKILIVDDEAGIVLEIKEFLELLQLQVLPDQQDIQVLLELLV